jgi:hypothetical protein
MLKEFSKSVVLIEKVDSYRIRFYRVEYEEGVREDLESGDILRILLDDCDFEKDLIRSVMNQILIKITILQMNSLNITAI